MPVQRPGLLRFAPEPIEGLPALLSRLVASPDGRALVGAEELPARGQELERVPRRRVVARGEDHAPRRPEVLHRDLRRRGGGEAEIDHVPTGAHEPRRDGAMHQRPGAPRIATDHHGAGWQNPGKGRGEARHDRGGQALADDAADAGDADHERSGHGGHTIRDRQVGEK